MTAGDPPGTVTICKGSGMFLRADDAGVLLRNFPFVGPVRRIAWTEIRRFEDGRNPYEQERPAWALLIALRTGKRVRAHASTQDWTSSSLATIQQVAQSHGIPAELSLIATQGGLYRPVSRGLYQDPGGEPGLRHWDGTQWSPLLPGTVKRRVKTSSPAWAEELPTANVSPGTWAAAKAKRETVKLTVSATALAALVVGALLPHPPHGLKLLLWVCAAAAAAAGFVTLASWRRFRVLGKAARAPRP